MLHTCHTFPLHAGHGPITSGTQDPAVGLMPQPNAVSNANCSHFETLQEKKNARLQKDTKPLPIPEKEGAQFLRH